MSVDYHEFDLFVLAVNETVVDVQTLEEITVETKNEDSFDLSVRTELVESLVLE